jgi:hypothetical protein
MPIAEAMAAPKADEIQFPQQPIHTGGSVGSGAYLVASASINIAARLCPSAINERTVQCASAGAFGTISTVFFMALAQSCCAISSTELLSCIA